MSIRAIRMYGDPVLTTPARDIEVFDESVIRLAHDMFETMDAAGGVGLAGNQIGIAKRIFVYDCTRVSPGTRGVIINPDWEAIGESENFGNEGCLSIPGVSLSVPRWQTVSVSGVDIHGRPVGMVVSGLMARCVQHETDHLEGTLFLDRVSPSERKSAMAQIRSSDWFNK